MSTRGCIARATGEGTFVGVYHHSDSYGTGLGDTLIALYRDHFKRNLNYMLQVLIDESPCGWSSIVGKDFSLRPGYTWQRAIKDGAKYEVYSKRPDYRRPQRFGDNPFEITEKDEDTDCEFAYVIQTVNEKNLMHVLDRAPNEDSSGYHWRDIGTIDLDSDAPADWDEIQCGKSEGWTRCRHTAEYHGIDSRLAMQTYLGHRPLDPIHDAVGYIIGGKKYNATGSGGNSDYLRRMTGRNLPPNTWVASLKTRNNRRVELPIARIENNRYELLKNVQALFPPTARRAE